MYTQLTAAPGASSGISLNAGGHALNQTWVHLPRVFRFSSAGYSAMRSAGLQMTVTWLGSSS